MKHTQKKGGLLSLLGKGLSETLICTVFFIIGYIIGNFIDYGFYTLYLTGTPDQKDNMGVLTGVFIFQIYTVIFLFLAIEYYSKDTHCQTFLQIGLLSSQIFMIQYTLYVFVKPFTSKGGRGRSIWGHIDANPAQNNNDRRAEMIL